MLNIDEILGEFPERLRGFKENILKEYLQYKILDIVFGSQYADGLVFMGGTAIRILHGGTRFSEDLDFDNRGLASADFEALSEHIVRELALEGYEVLARNVLKGAYHCHIKFPGLLYAEGLSGYKEERILIRIDAESQNFEYEPARHLLNRFGIFRYIKVVPPALLLSQKILACLRRKRAMGRDFFDVVFLMSKTDPDYEYLRQRADIGDKGELVDALRRRSVELNMQSLAKDVAPFLFDPSQKDRVSRFQEWLATL
jgi:predicted nucleotidyltransferase component of viral defense system